MKKFKKIGALFVLILFVVIFVISAFITLGAWFEIYFGLTTALEEARTLDYTLLVLPFLFVLYNTILHLWLATSIIKSRDRYLLLFLILIVNYIIINIFWERLGFGLPMGMNF